ncbi:MAG: glycogen/starch/alpha-glucan phosphorylase [Tissierellia bacterium]|nr:glycogen/starch/alpha-glucan phosphorylase [Tissierellia bacterium]
MDDKKQFLQRKIEENLYEFFAKDMKSARDSELYIAIAKSLRYIIGKNWFRSVQKIKKEKTLYMLSFEYSLGTRLTSNARKLGVIKELKELLQDAGRDFSLIRDQEIESALGFGDLGIMSSEMLDSLTNLDQNVYAYGLRYRKGMLKQEIVNGAQVEKPDDWKEYKNPWEHEKGFYHKLNVGGLDIKAIPYDYPIVGNRNEKINTLRLWKSESENDIDFNLFSKGRIQDSYADINKANSIVEFIYPQEDTYEGRKLRLSQEYFFAAASIRDILKKYDKYHGSQNIKDFSNRVLIQINDVHPVLSMIVFIERLINRYKVSFEDAVDLCKNSFVFINFSLIHESFEKWDLSLIKEVCPDLIEIIEKVDKLLDQDLKNSRQSYVSYELLSMIRYDYIEMINIAFFLSKKVYIPTKQHDRVLEQVYLPHHYAYYRDKIELLEMGFDSLDYLEESNPCLYEKIEQEDSLDKAEIDQDLIEDLYRLKQEKKKELLDFLGDSAKFVNVNSVFDMNLGIIHEYKRQLLSALSIGLLYYQLKKNSSLDVTPRTYFFGGKSYPNYYFAKEIIKFINALAHLINNDYSIKDKIKIVFVEDFNVNKSHRLIPAADINESLAVVTKGSVDLAISKYFINGSVGIFSSNSVALSFKEEMDQGETYIFGPDENEAIDRELSNKHYVYEFVNNNRIIVEMMEYYRFLPYNIFPYDFNVIIDNLLKYNDGYFVIKDLLDYHRVHEKAMADYRNRELWTKNRLQSIKYAKNHQMKRATKNNISNYWR